MYKISKMVWESKIALATILLGFLFVGGASLRAQEGSENGWFVSASPLIFGANKIETKTTITASGGGEVTVGDLTADIRTTLNDDYDNAAQNTARDLCAGTLVGAMVEVNGVDVVVLDNIEIVYLAEDRSSSTDLTYISGGSIGAVRFSLNGEDVPVKGDTATIPVTAINTNLSPIADSACKDAFDGLLLQDLSASASSSETSVGKALAGNGFQVGYRDGDYRYSFTNYSWAAETDKLDLQLAMIEYYLAKGLLLGLGTANVKLDSSLGSQSQRATAYSVSYQYPLFKNFFVEANYTLLQTNLSLQKETIIAEAAISQTDTREVGIFTKGGVVPLNNTADQPFLYYEESSGGLLDHRTTVTRTQTRSAFQSTQTKTVEVKNPSALTIKFTYKFW